MADIFDSSKRSEVMSKIRSKNTKAELIAFRYLRKQGIYFQKHYAKAPGSPDIALPRKKKAVFIDGDFWHGRTFNRVLERRGNDPEDYWIKKIARNMERDKQQETALLKSGWAFLRVWDSDLVRKRTSADTLIEIFEFLHKV